MISITFTVKNQSTCNEPSWLSTSSSNELDYSITGGDYNYFQKKVHNGKCVEVIFSQSNKEQLKV